MIYGINKYFLKIIKKILFTNEEWPTEKLKEFFKKSFFLYNFFSKIFFLYAKRFYKKSVIFSAAL